MGVQINMHKSAPDLANVLILAQLTLMILRPDPLHSLIPAN